MAHDHGPNDCLCLSDVCPYLSDVLCMCLSNVLVYVSLTSLVSQISCMSFKCLSTSLRCLSTFLKCLKCLSTSLRCPSMSFRYLSTFLRCLVYVCERHLWDVLGMSLRCLVYMSLRHLVYVSLRLIAGNPPPRGGFLFSMFPNQEPGERGPLSKHLVHILWGGPLPPVSCLERIVNRKPPRGAGFFRSRCLVYVPFTCLVYVSLWCLAYVSLRCLVACRCLLIVCVCLCLSTL